MITTETVHKNISESKVLPENISNNNGDEGLIIFTQTEWKYFLDELKMRGVDKIAQCVNNAHYLARLDSAFANIDAGRWTEHGLIEVDDSE